jgi:hypothetical protein
MAKPIAVLVAAALLFGAHVAHARLAVNRLAVNRLTAHKIAAGTAAANPLAARKLARNTFAADPAAVDDLLATPEGQELLGYIVSCALPESIVLRAMDPQTGDILEFFGGIGLAKSWIRKPLNAVGRRWVSACLFARTNDHDVTIPISMRGPHRALAVDPGEAASWTLEEGAFFGDYFAAGDESTACRGEDEAAGESGFLDERDCSEPDPGDPTQTQCGFNYAGDCGDFAPAPVCEHFPADGHGFYRNCHAQPIVPRDKSRKFKQVITVFLPSS